MRQLAVPDTPVGLMMLSLVSVSYAWIPGNRFVVGRVALVQMMRPTEPSNAFSAAFTFPCSAVVGEEPASVSVPST